jgi:hypothetical protein
MIADGVEAREISGYSNYAVTRDGRIWSSLGGGKFLRPFGGRPYFQVWLCCEGMKTKRYVHRLVLESWVGPCPPAMECRHLNGNSHDNRVENLAWGTHSENSKDTIRHGTFHSGLPEIHPVGEEAPNSRLREREVRTIIYAYRTGEFTQQGIADMYGISRRLVGAIAHRETWKHIWTR